ncbi:DNA repair protein REV1 isoform X2 [Selaginella moellendorffii]|uniref:DNA repair protein REV1 isoform X2 n=1 Tax=Selaginella moellendorffii TaxID=88036 RepID=UPI000D1C922B|nr:DNA repair protein REV1 isoform X2 [Selaginella moellendorffii]|eukprot:XP_024543050.1 DNA repair protein REV1 isoform X2 [Selaginella moellendorffii]
MGRKKEKAISPAPKRPGASWGAGSPASKRSASARTRDEGMGDFGRYMTNKVRKLGEQFQAEASNPEASRGNADENSIEETTSKIFEGISIHVNGFTIPSHQELRTLMLRHGGTFENYFSKTRVTHIICSNLPQSKIKEFRSFSKGLPVLKPGWIVDSIAVGKLLPWASYQLEAIYSNQSTLSSFYGTRKLLQDGTENVEEQELVAEAKPDTSHPNLAGDGAGKEIEYDEQDEEGGAEEVNVEDGLSENEYMEHRRSHSTLDDPNFVQNYFKYSRLHFIGTWRNRYQATVQMQRRVTLDPALEKSIIHVDMDCFFVSVVTRNRPELDGKPVGVCHSDSSKGTGEISSANYEARTFGVKAGMFVKTAKKCCPNLEIVSYDFEGYEQVADKLYEILHRHSPLVQAISCDEAYLDVSGMGDPASIASAIRREIFEATRCTASAGISANILLARLATKKAKPNGQFQIHLQEAEEFMMNLPVEELPGVGWVLREKLHALKLFTCSDLRLLTSETLRKHFGAKTGETLYNHARGIDHRKVQAPQEKKSIGAEVNWGVRFSTLADAQNFLVTLSEEVASRLRKAAVHGRTFTMKVKKRKSGAGEPEKFMGCGICDNISRSTTLPSGTNSSDVLSRISRQLFGSLNLDVRDVRGVGLQVTRLEDLSNEQEQTRLESWITNSPDKRLKQRTDSKPDRSIEPELPPASEIDPCFLESLPPDLFDELNNAYKGELASIKLSKVREGACSKTETEASKVENNGNLFQCEQDSTESDSNLGKARDKKNSDVFDVWDTLSHFQTSESKMLRDMHDIYTSVDSPKHLSQVLVVLNATSHCDEADSDDSISICSKFISQYLLAILYSDLEEVSAVIRLLKRLATKSDGWNRVCACVLPTTQVRICKLSSLLHDYMLFFLVGPSLTSLWRLPVTIEAFEVQANTNNSRTLSHKVVSAEFYTFFLLMPRKNIF